MHMYCNMYIYIVIVIYYDIFEIVEGTKQTNTLVSFRSLLILNFFAPKHVHQAEPGN